ncbi:hypothetical protein [Alkaliphilus transvaalensis]|uniref:hypothetical protein n=1 Tax=Alkaliphilus transvaalensis TaxID=114628 RepID=UPI00047ACE89|nr:hypothetical protein [Alkaliphilus transvaalensis]
MKKFSSKRILMILALVILITSSITYGATRSWNLLNGTAYYRSDFIGQKNSELGVRYDVNYYVRDQVEKRSNSNAILHSRQYVGASSASSNLQFGILWIYDEYGNNSVDYWHLFGMPVRNTNYTFSPNWSFANFNTTNRHLITDQFFQDGTTGLSSDKVVYRVNTAGTLSIQDEVQSNIEKTDLEMASSNVDFNISTLESLPDNFNDSTNVYVIERSNLPNLIKQSWTDDKSGDFIIFQQTPKLHTSDSDIAIELNIQERIIENEWIGKTIVVLNWEDKGMVYSLAGTLSDTVSVDTLYTLFNSIQ